MELRARAISLTNRANKQTRGPKLPFFLGRARANNGRESMKTNLFFGQQLIFPCSSLLSSSARNRSWPPKLKAERESFGRLKAESDERADLDVIRAAV